ncbi:hypothetical protein FOZ60_013500 [Perkinsus olseni]|uniref:Uncharacterized protein n=1 Tax=Perkinsus olseni TaxID=32597 RepID=A0A7J6P9F8_PEROL|nr:hypothetical protein FOZ60_013500 [Perkinsus olseni]
MMIEALFSMAHCFLNSKEKFVSDALDGLVATSGGSIARLVTADEDTQVIVRTDWTKRPCSCDLWRR